MVGLARADLARDRALDWYHRYLNKPYYVCAPGRLVIYGFIADHMKRNISPCAPAYGPLCLPVSSVRVDEQGRPTIRPPVEGLFAVNRRFWDEFFFARGTGLPPLRAHKPDLVNLIEGDQPANGINPGSIGCNVLDNKAHSRRKSTLAQENLPMPRGPGT